MLVDALIEKGTGRPKILGVRVDEPLTPPPVEVRLYAAHDMGDLQLRARCSTNRSASAE
jgi:hypothetical protein